MSSTQSFARNTDNITSALEIGLLPLHFDKIPILEAIFLDFGRRPNFDSSTIIFSGKNKMFTRKSTNKNEINTKQSYGDLELKNAAACKLVTFFMVIGHNIAAFFIWAILCPFPIWLKKHKHYNPVWVL